MLRVAPVVFPTRRARHGRRDARDAPEPELDLDLDPVIKNDAIVIEDDTDTDTDTTASGDTERCVECWRWLLLHPHFQCPGCFGMIHARCAAQHAMRHQQEDGMARAPQGRGAQGRGAQD